MIPVLTYFSAPGRAFAIRVVMGLANVEYVNKTITFPELVAGKADTTAFPLGAVPTLTVGDKTFAQSGAILRFASKAAGLYPADALAALAFDEALDSAQEFSGSVPQLPDAELKKAARAAWVEKKLPVFGNYFGRKIAASGGPFIFGASISSPDLVLFSSLDGIAKGDWDFISPAVLDAHAWVPAFLTAVRTHPAVVQYGGLKQAKA
jgi:glutathione S-transferase